MEWLFILFPIIGIATLVILLIIVNIKKENGDHNDGGGKRYGGSNKVGFFQPTQKRTGQLGEIYVNSVLRRLLRNDEYLLANVLIPLKNGHFAEIDCILISRKGIFCIETKSWVGHIRGLEANEMWRQSYDDPHLPNKDIKNPVKQNAAHCEILERQLNFKYAIHNAIIFPNCDSLRTDSDVVYTDNLFKKYFRHLPEDKLNEKEIENVFESLKGMIATPEQIEEHIKAISSKGSK